MNDRESCRALTSCNELRGGIADAMSSTIPCLGRGQQAPGYRKWACTRGLLSKALFIARPSTRSLRKRLTQAPATLERNGYVATCPGTAGNARRTRGMTTLPGARIAASILLRLRPNCCNSPLRHEAGTKVESRRNDLAVHQASARDRQQTRATTCRWISSSYSRIQFVATRVSPSAI